MLGEVIDGKYRVVRQLGQGGMGAVYEAIHEGTSRRVAVKVILNAGATTNKETVVRFQREARAAGAIDTQHIVQVFDTGTDPKTNHPYMVMEYLAGEDISDVVQRVGALPPDIALRIVAQAAIGLQRAHERGVVHRDIKPANLYLSRMEDDGLLVKVLDFGIAKVAMDLVTTAENASLTRTGSMLGSPLYMSPEQARGLRSIGPQTDIWSLGVVFYETLCGSSPNASAESLGQLILAICSEQPRPIQELAPWVVPEIARIVHRMLQPDVTRRYASMADVVEDIRKLLPQGFTLTNSMVIALPPQVRAQVAPKLVQSNAGATALMQNGSQTGTQDHSRDSQPFIQSASTGSSTGNRPNPPNGSTLDLSVHALSQRDGATTGGGMPIPKSSAGTRILVALLACGLVGAILIAAVVQFKKTEARRKEGPAITAPIVVTAPTPLVASGDSKPLTVSAHLAVEPVTADVEVDGVKAVVNEGVVTIEGTPGSSHKVHLTHGKRVLDADVVVTDKATTLPDHLQLGKPVLEPAPGPTLVKKLSPTQPSTPGTTSPASKPTAPDKGVDRNKDEFGK